MLDHVVYLYIKVNEISCYTWSRLREDVIPCGDIYSYITCSLFYWFLCACLCLPMISSKYVVRIVPMLHIYKLPLILWVCVENLKWVFFFFWQSYKILVSVARVQAMIRYLNSNHSVVVLKRLTSIGCHCAWIGSFNTKQGAHIFNSVAVLMLCSYLNLCNSCQY